MLGFLNVVGNKGGVAVALSIRNKSFLFFNCHLAAGHHEHRARMKEWSRLQSEFPLGKGQHDHTSVPVQHRFDYTIWMGDFNSRIEDTQFRVNAEVREFADTLLLDQLLQERLYNFHSPAHDFREGMIHFPPSYKLQTHALAYTMGREWRVPGWTDQIMFCESDGVRPRVKAAKRG